MSTERIIMSTTYVADSSTTVGALTFPDRGPILSTSFGVGQSFTLSQHPDSTLEAAEAFADRIVTAALAFAEATREHAARVRQAAAEATYLDNVRTGEQS